MKWKCIPLPYETVINTNRGLKHYFDWRGECACVGGVVMLSTCVGMFRLFNCINVCLLVYFCSLRSVCMCVCTCVYMHGSQEWDLDNVND